LLWPSAAPLFLPWFLRREREAPWSFELCLAHGGRRLADVLELVFADFDDVVVLEEVLLHRLAVDQRAVGAAQILEKESLRMVMMMACSPLTARLSI